jgi:hypothetical protein
MSPGQTCRTEIAPLSGKLWGTDHVPVLLLDKMTDPLEGSESILVEQLERDILEWDEGLMTLPQP